MKIENKNKIFEKKCENIKNQKQKECFRSLAKIPVIKFKNLESTQLFLSVT